MQRTHTTFTYKVTIRKDGVPGWNHQPEDFQRYLQRHLDEAIAHYHPAVEFIGQGAEVTDTVDPDSRAGTSDPRSPEDFDNLTIAERARPND